MVVLLLACLLAPVYTLWQLRPARMAALGRNAWIGMRSEATTRSNKAWAAAHEAAWPASRTGCVISSVVFGGAAACVPLLPAGDAERVTSVAMIGGFLVYGGFLVVAFVASERSAKSVPR